MFDSLINWLKGVLETVLTWIKDFFVWLGQALYSSLMDGLASALESIPQPDFVGQAARYRLALFTSFRSSQYLRASR